MIKRYFSAVSGRQLAMMLLGNLLLGMGISVFKLSGLGNDAYNGFLMALGDRTGVPFALLAVLVGGAPCCASCWASEQWWPPSGWGLLSSGSATGWSRG